MKVYLAGLYEQRSQIRKLAKELQAGGIELVHAWWDVEAGDFDKDAMGYEFFMEGCAESDENAVRAADEVWCAIWEDPDWGGIGQGHNLGRGCWWEMGLAKGLGKPTYVVMASDAERPSLLKRCIFLTRVTHWHQFKPYRSSNPEDLRSDIRDMLILMSSHANYKPLDIDYPPGMDCEVSNAL